MAVTKLNIIQFLEMAGQYPVIDVRSPSEFKHAHIPGAYSLPLFTDEERAAVGTAYKQESREKAIKIGLDFFGPKMRRMVEEVEGIGNLELGIRTHSSAITGDKDSSTQFQIPNSKFLLIYCWRGGMRSAGVAWLLDLYGYKVFTLVGGYKKFRNLTLETFRQNYSFKILGGFTGSGKTEVLKELQNKKEIVINLEEIAKHKGSAFGNIGLPQQPSQEMFENILGNELRSAHEKLIKKNGNDDLKSVTNSPFTTHHSPIWLEDESQRIGLVNIPKDIWTNMRVSPVFFLDIPFEERLDFIVSEYGGLDSEKMVDAIGRISQRLGGMEAKNAVSLLSEGKTRESFRILLTYYDRWYLKGLHNREGLNSLLYTVKCDSVSPLNANKLLPQPEYYEKP